MRRRGLTIVAYVLAAIMAVVFLAVVGLFVRIIMLPRTGRVDGTMGPPATRPDVTHTDSRRGDPAILGRGARGAVHPESAHP